MKGIKGVTYFDIASGKIPNHRVKYVYGDLLNPNNVETTTEYTIPDGWIVTGKLCQNKLLLLFLSCLP